MYTIQKEIICAEYNWFQLILKITIVVIGCYSLEWFYIKGLRLIIAPKC